VISLDTNILARYYVDTGQDDAEAARQRPLALKIIESRQPLFVSRTAVLELAWLLRAAYRFGPEDVCRVVTHLLGLPRLTVEDAPLVAAAVETSRKGIDFADAMHFAASTGCAQLVTFDRRFSKKVADLGLVPPVSVPSA
jgi:predicted nucleic-acid-binding protein